MLCGPLRRSWTTCIRSFGAAPFALKVALASGLRRNELFAAEWDRFDAGTRTLRVTRQLDKAERGRFSPPKSKRPRTVLVLPS
jgi:integrase